MTSQRQTFVRHIPLGQVIVHLLAFATMNTSKQSKTTTGAVLLAPSMEQYGLMYYLKGAASGGICCSITHGALTPVDVVKTRVQLDPVKVRSRRNAGGSVCYACVEWKEEETLCGALQPYITMEIHRPFVNLLDRI